MTPKNKHDEDVNAVRNSLVFLQDFALSNDDEYLENLAEKSLKALERLAATLQQVELTKSAKKQNE